MVQLRDVLVGALGSIALVQGSMHDRRYLAGVRKSPTSQQILTSKSVVDALGGSGMALEGTVVHVTKDRRESKALPWFGQSRF